MKRIGPQGTPDKPGQSSALVSNPLFAERRFLSKKEKENRG